MIGSATQGRILSSQSSFGSLHAPLPFSEVFLAPNDRIGSSLRPKVGSIPGARNCQWGLQALSCSMMIRPASRPLNKPGGRGSFPKTLSPTLLPRLHRQHRAILLETRLRAEKLLQRAETRALRACSLATKHAASPISTPRAAATR